jgi:hypothetical protein
MVGAGGHSPGLFPPGPLGGFQGGLTGGPPLYHVPPPVINGGYRQVGGCGIPAYLPGLAPVQAQVHRPRYSNVVKYYGNWNACYSCRFDVTDGHRSMTCPTNLHKSLHHIGFN